MYPLASASTFSDAPVSRRTVRAFSSTTNAGLLISATICFRRASSGVCPVFSACFHASMSEPSCALNAPSDFWRQYSHAWRTARSSGEHFIGPVAVRRRLISL